MIQGNQLRFENLCSAHGVWQEETWGLEGSTVLSDLVVMDDLNLRFSKVLPVGRFVIEQIELYSKDMKINRCDCVAFVRA